MKREKTVSGANYSSDDMKTVWYFDLLDRSGKFAFDLTRGDFHHHEVLEKIIAYSNMTWTEIKRQTHDKGKSKHHFLDMSKLSAEAMERIEAKQFEEQTDSIFSFALQNKLRLIGLRKNEQFHVVWYDPNHEFCPSSKK